MSSCSALRRGPGQREAEEGFPVLASGSLPCASCQEGTCRAGHPARGHQGRSTTRGTYTCASPLSLVPRDLGHPHEPGCGMWRGPCSCGSTTSQLLFLVSTGLVFSLRLGDSSKKSVEPSARCGQLGHLKMGVFIGSGPGSLWLRGVGGDGHALSCLPLALFKVVAPRPDSDPKDFSIIIRPGEAIH